jgi:hypothetical protein
MDGMVEVLSVQDEGKKGYRVQVAGYRVEVTK